MKFSSIKKRGRRGGLGLRPLIVMACVVTIAFAPSCSGDYTDTPTTDRLQELTGARVAQTIEGSNAFLVIPDEHGFDSFYCVLHYTGVVYSTRIIGTSVKCIDNTGTAVDPPFPTS